MSLPVKCTYCEGVNLAEVVSGVLECGHVYCDGCLYKLWHEETAAAAERREARAHQGRLNAQTRTQVHARAIEDAADNGRNLRCPFCQECTSVESVRQVYPSSSQVPSTAPSISPQTVRRTTSTSTASAEEVVEDLRAQLASAIQHLDTAHAHAADTARAHDLSMHQLHAQLVAHAEQAHQSHVRGLAETNAQLQHELSNAQAQINHATRKADEMRDQLDRAVKELTHAREKEREAKARASDVMAKKRDAAMDKLADKLSANGTLRAPLRGGSETTGVAGRTRSTIKLPASPTMSDARKPDNRSSGRGIAMSSGFGTRGPVLTPQTPSRPSEGGGSAPFAVRLQPKSESISSATRSSRVELGVPESSQSRTKTANSIEQKPKIENRVDDFASLRDETELEVNISIRHTRATSSTKATTREVQVKRETGPVAPGPSSKSTTNTGPTSHDDHRSPEKQQSLRESAEAEGRRWPISEDIIVPPCKVAFQHDFKGIRSNGTHLRHTCEKCGWGCREPKPAGYIPESQRRAGIKYFNKGT